MPGFSLHWSNSHHPELLSHGQQFVSSNERSPAYVDSLSMQDPEKQREQFAAGQTVTIELTDLYMTHMCGNSPGCASVGSLARQSSNTGSQSLSLGRQSSNTGSQSLPLGRQSSNTGSQSLPLGRQSLSNTGSQSLPLGGGEGRETLGRTVVMLSFLLHEPVEQLRSSKSILRKSLHSLPPFWRRPSIGK